MSNHLISHQFQFLDGQVVYTDHLPERMESLTGDIQNNMVGRISSTSVSTHFTVSNEQLGSVKPVRRSSGFQNVIVSNNQIGQIESKGGILGVGAGEVMVTNLGSQKAFLPSKRKAEMETTSNSGPQNLVIPNKRTMQLGIPLNSPQLLQPSSPHKKSMQMQSKVGPSIMQNVTASNKKMVRNESTSNRSSSQRLQTSKGRTVQNEPFSKMQTESFGAVRSKMMEQLAAALALAYQNQDKTANTENNHEEASVNNQNSTDSQPNRSDLGAVGVQQHSHDPFPSGESSSAGEFSGAQGTPAKLPTSECTGNPAILTEEDVSFSDNFFAKDDLLQGNGLSWALDLDMQVMEEKENPNIEKAQVLHDGGTSATEQAKSPEKLASEIEAELFKLFGGVNKKYKEKGRSLLFNLKDRNNPDLRERVMSGEITPERLCSMTAEELASKELSEWRMAKAEELAQMVVLPDTELGRRRLVKKTHKGEYQVEMEEDDGILVEVSGGSSSISQAQSRDKGVETRSLELGDGDNKENAASKKNGSENPDLSGSLIIPGDGGDLMQGMMVDELKDVEFLPPIISLDEFMESLNSEPPFENLQVDAGQSTPHSEKDNSEVGDKVAASDSTSKDHGDTPDKVDEEVMKHAIGETVKPKESPVLQRNSPTPPNALTVEHIWEGLLQLSISTSIKTFGVFRSGEKTSVTKWPSSLEVKGRVRLDAFEKFIKDLPMSRTRAVMVIHFLLKDDSAESERANLHEEIESYVSDDRLGFAEPATGVELYLCPTRGRVVNMLGNYLSKDRTDIFNSSDNGLIGVIVWRKVHITSTLLSNSSSHQKHTSLNRQQHFTSRRQQEKDSNVNVNMMNKKAQTPTQNGPYPLAVNPPPSNDYDSDIPPGFGPPAGAREDDDLPEFSFSRNIKHVSVPRPASQNLHTELRVGSSRPVDQIRELIHKYGKTEASSNGSSSWLGNRGQAVGLGIEPWNDDDDDEDDIPEWQPHQSRPGVHGFHQPLQSTYGSQNTLSTVARQQLNTAMVASQAPVNGPASYWHQGSRWAQPPGNMPGGGHYYGTPGVRSGLGQDSFQK